MDKDTILSALSAFLDNFGGSVINKATEEIPVIKAVDHELKQAIEVVYEPNKPDVHGDWMSPDTIRKACTNFNVNLEKGNLKSNLFHLKETEKFTIMKSWINEVESIIGETRIPEGTWLVKVQYNDDALWELKKSGVIQGVSIGAKGRRLDPKKPKLPKQQPEQVEEAVDKAAKKAKRQSKVKPLIPSTTVPVNNDAEQPMVPKHPEIATD